ncbi:hypothetical protein GGF50DRAFT_131315 [Schizophyllum commune]
MKAFISCLLKYDPTHRDLEGGVFGLVKAYYGCVEAQGRGTLHCHMLVWLEGGLNPNEIRKRVMEDDDFRTNLVAFLEDTISNAVPPDPDPELKVASSTAHPCSVRGVELTLPKDERSRARQKDMHHLVKQCQSHSHSKTCFKYWKGPPEPKVCRFNLDESNVRPTTVVDPETGEICLRCLDGLVNNFNATILEAIRCNMDVQFIGSGASAKAILYYITNYITKTQLKAHVAYAALELAVKKLGQFNPDEDEKEIRAKKMLQKCAYALISHQELSAQQVASYLLDFEDHFTSDKYINLYWTPFETFINRADPSPECYSTTADIPSKQQSEFTERTVKDTHEADEADMLEEEDDSCEPDLDAKHEEVQCEDDEVVISVNRNGTLQPSSNQVVDYCARGDELEHINIWDFLSRVKKRLGKMKTYYWNMTM